VFAATLLLTTPLFAALFENSVVSNDIDFIRSDELFLDQVITFLLKYEDGGSVEVWASPVLKDSASRYANLVGVALGKLPCRLAEKAFPRGDSFRRHV